MKKSEIKMERTRNKDRREGRYEKERMTKLTIENKRKIKEK